VQGPRPRTEQATQTDLEIPNGEERAANHRRSIAHHTGALYLRKPKEIANRSIRWVHALDAEQAEQVSRKTTRR